MTLEDLLRYENIVIQCHDDPDADTIASGYALLKYLESKGKSPRLVYGGGRKVTKNNLLLMIEKLSIPLEHVRGTNCDAELLITVDCRAGQRNVSALPHQTLAVIDHHELDMGEVLPELREVRTDCSACVTVMWAMLKKPDSPLRTVCCPPLCTMACTWIPKSSRAPRSWTGKCWTHCGSIGISFSCSRARLWNWMTSGLRATRL